jgi:hypothetical protein
MPASSLRATVPFTRQPANSVGNTGVDETVAVEETAGEADGEAKPPAERSAASAAAQNNSQMTKEMEIRTTQSRREEFIRKMRTNPTELDYRQPEKVSTRFVAEIV